MQFKKVIADIEFEIERIEKLIDKYQPLINKIKEIEPDFIELGSLAMLLHSFYNGIENIFNRIAKKIDESIPSKEFWHKKLLEQMSKVSKNRKSIVLSNDAYENLQEYLGFRHFSRHAYAFDLDWKLMKNLIFRLKEVKTIALNDIRKFIKKYK